MRKDKIKKITKSICDQAGVTVKELFKRRWGYNSEVKRIIYYVLTDYHKFTLSEVARYFGATHATIIHHRNKARIYAKNDFEFQQLFAELTFGLDDEVDNSYISILNKQLEDSKTNINVLEQQIKELTLIVKAR